MTPQIQQAEQGWLIPAARTETKPEAMKRGRRMQFLLGAIEGAPQDIENYQDMADSLQWFIDRAKAHEFDENSTDGLCRLLGGDIEELECCEVITDDEYRQMREDRSLWKKAIPGHLSYPPGFEYYCVTLHPKEIAALGILRDDSLASVEAVREAVIEFERELTELRELPLPAAVTAKLNLTADGHRIKETVNVID